MVTDGNRSPGPPTGFRYAVRLYGFPDEQHAAALFLAHDRRLHDPEFFTTDDRDLIQRHQKDVVDRWRGFQILKIDLKILKGSY